MVWVRMVGVIAALAVIVAGYVYWNDRSEASARRERRHLALITARVWVGTADYRNDPARFLLWRDSLLASENLTTDSMAAYLRNYQSEPEGYEEYTRLVGFFVDSLVLERGARPDSVRFDSLNRELFLE